MLSCNYNLKTSNQVQFLSNTINKTVVSQMYATNSKRKQVDMTNYFISA